MLFGGALLSKGVSDLPKTTLELSTPMFTNLLGSAARKVIDSFHRDNGQLCLFHRSHGRGKDRRCAKSLGIS
jgi:hypothetical protein